MFELNKATSRIYPVMIESKECQKSRSCGDSRVEKVKYMSVLIFHLFTVRRCTPFKNPKNMQINIVGAKCFKDMQINYVRVPLRKIMPCSLSFLFLF